MAAAWFNRLADPARAEAVSAGTEPAARVHPEVLAVMAEVGIDLGKATPTLLSDALARSSHVMVTMGCGEACPHVPGLERIDWALQDPKGQPLATVRVIRDDIRARVERMLVSRAWKNSAR